MKICLIREMLVGSLSVFVQVLGTHEGNLQWISLIKVSTVALLLFHGP